MSVYFLGFGDNVEWRPQIALYFFTRLLIWFFYVFITRVGRLTSFHTRTVATFILGFLLSNSNFAIVDGADWFPDQCHFRWFLRNTCLSHLAESRIWRRRCIRKRCQAMHYTLKRFYLWLMLDHFSMRDVNWLSRFLTGRVLITFLLQWLNTWWRKMIGSI